MRHRANGLWPVDGVAIAATAVKNIPHWLDVRGNIEHDWPLWLEMLPHYVSLIGK